MSPAMVVAEGCKGKDERGKLKENGALGMQIRSKYRGQEEQVDGRAAMRDWWMGLLEPQGFVR